MSRRSQALAALVLLAGCGPPPPAGACEAIDPSPAVDRVEILGDERPYLALDDGAVLPLLFGGQGSAMALFRVGVFGADLPECVPLEVHALDAPGGNERLAVVSPLRTEAFVDGARATGPLAAVQPGDTLVIEARAGDAEIVRTLSVGGARIGVRVEAPSSIPVGEPSTLEIALSGRAVEPVTVGLSTSPAGRLDAPASVDVATGLDRATVAVTPLAEGTVEVWAAIGAYESPPVPIEITP